MSYDSALIVEADLVKITGVQDTANLEGDSELDRADLILEAHRAIYRRLEQAFGATAPTLLTNQDRLKSAVAWEAIKRLQLGGYLGESPTVDQAQAEVDRELEAFRPEYSTGNESRNAREGVPAISTMDSGWTYGPTNTRRIGQTTWKGIPRSR